MLKKIAVAMCWTALASTIVACGKEKTTETGLKYIIRKDVSSGITPQDSDYVEINYDMYVTVKGKDSLLQSSSMTPQPDRMMVAGAITHKGSLGEGLKLMNEGDSLAMLIPSDSLFLKQFRMPSVPEFVDKGSVVRLELGLSKIITRKQADSIMNAQMQAYIEQQQKAQKELEEQKPLQDQKIKDFLKGNSTAKRSDSGLYYVIKSVGKGADIKAGDTVSVHYRGTTFDTNEEFDTSKGKDPLTYPAKVGMMIPGFDEGVSYLKEGGKADLYLPAHLAYGSQGQPPIIKPFSILKFEIEVIKVKPAKKM